MFEHTFIGLDVHAVNVVGHALNPATGEISNHPMAADPAMVLEWVRRFEPPAKERITPLDAATAMALKTWYEENLSPAPASAVFTAQGGCRPMTTDAVAQRLRDHTTAAAATCPTLATKPLPRTFSGTPTPCGCSPRASTPQPFPSGWAMNPWNRPRHTFTPTWASSNGRWTGPHRRTPCPDDTHRQTPCWNSWKTSG